MIFKEEKWFTRRFTWGKANMSGKWITYIMYNYIILSNKMFVCCVHSFKIYFLSSRKHHRDFDTMYQFSSIVFKKKRIATTNVVEFKSKKCSRYNLIMQLKWMLSMTKLRLLRNIAILHILLQRISATNFIYKKYSNVVNFINLTFPTSNMCGTSIGFECRCHYFCTLFQ